MNILFLTLIGFESINEKNIYTDLLREFVKQGHTVCIISPIEKRYKKTTHLVKEGKSTIVRLQIGNTQKTNILEKGISTVLIEPQYKKAIKKFFSDIKFDLVLYSTPPITLVSAIEYVKRRDNAKTYLLLKDIFPQNAVDLGMMNKTGIKAPLYYYFRNKEKRLYDISDHIGCMSQANVNYVLRHNPAVLKRNRENIQKNRKGIIDVCPNCIEPIDLSLSYEERLSVRQKYNIPSDKTVFVYGGNLGKPQGIDFMLECLKSQSDNDKVFFLIIGNGTEYGLIDKYIRENDINNIMLRQWMPKDDYDKVVAACDIGMIFLDHRFTIPNFPSRLLSYMQARLPVLAVTDASTDIGVIITEGNFGWWCESDSVGLFSNLVNSILSIDIDEKRCMAFKYLAEKYNVEKVSMQIIDE